LAGKLLQSTYFTHEHFVRVDWGVGAHPYVVRSVAHIAANAVKVSLAPVRAARRLPIAMANSREGHGMFIDCAHILADFILIFNGN
jgi:hypothetical protein